MGCCFSNDEDKDDDLNDPSRALINPISDGASSRPIGGRYNSTESHPQQKGDEQSALNRILQEVASNVVDIAAIDAQGVDQVEYQDRAKQYSQRLSSWCTGQRSRGPPSLPVGVAAPQTALSGQPVSLADIQLITSATHQAVKSLQEIKVRHKEDLVVPFGVP